MAVAIVAHHPDHALYIDEVTRLKIKEGIADPVREVE